MSAVCLLAAGACPLKLPAAAAAGAVPTAASAPTTRLLQGTFLLDGIACANATRCVTVGASPSLNGVVVQVTNGGPGAARVAPQIGILYGVGCSSAVTCEAVGVTSAHSSTGGVTNKSDVLSITNGVPGAATFVPGAYSLNAVACPSTTLCIAVGSSNRSQPQGVVLPIVNGVPGALWTVPGTDVLNGVACTSATACEAVGSTKSDAGTVVFITNGRPARASIVANIGLFAIACATSASCEAVGSSANEGSVVPIANGVPGSSQPVPATYALLAVACPSANTCEAAAGTGSFPAIVGAVLPITDGGAGTPQPVPPAELLKGIACPQVNTCEAVGRTSDNEGLLTITHVTPVCGAGQVSGRGAQDGLAPNGSLFDGTYRLGPGDGSQNPTSGKGPFGQLDGVYADILVCAPHPDKGDSGNNTSAWVMLQKYGDATDHWQVGWEWYPNSPGRDPAILVEIDQPGKPGGSNVFADCDNLNAASSVQMTCYKTPCSQTTSAKCWPSLKVGFYAFFTVLYNGTTFSAYVATENPLTGKYSSTKEVAHVTAKFVPNQADISAETHYIDDQMPGTAQNPERFLNCHIYIPGLKWVAFDGHEKFNGKDVFFTTVDGLNSTSWFGQSNPNSQELLVWDKDAS